MSQCSGVTYTLISDFNQSDKTAADLGKMVKNVSIPLIISGILVEMIRRLAQWGYSGFQKEFNTKDLIWSFFTRILGNWLVARDVTDIIGAGIDAAQKKPVFLRKPRVNPLTDFYISIFDFAIHVGTAVGTESDVTRKKNIQKAMFDTVNLVSASGGLPFPGLIQIIRHAWPKKKDNRKIKLTPRKKISISQPKRIKTSRRIKITR